MQIRLQQAEIVTAIKQYVSNQGISLSGKTVQIDFTAGRGAAGLSADIVIEEATLPDLVPEAAKPVLSVVSNEPAMASTELPAAEPMAEAQATGTDDAAAPVTTGKSLFS